jgi:hypothetical protein
MPALVVHSPDFVSTSPPSLTSIASCCGSLAISSNARNWSSAASGAQVLALNNFSDDQ